MISSMAGFKVYVSPDTPKMKLAPGDYVTPEFRQEIDTWLREFFGVTNLIKDGEYLISEKFGFVNMNPRTYEQLKLLTQGPKT